MSSLWTPSGERPVPGPDQPASPSAPAAGSTPPGDADPEAHVEELRRQIAEAPGEIVVANHAYGIFELAAIYLSQNPPLLPQAQLAIDALAYLVEGLGDRLGEAAPSLREALAQVRVAYVQLNAAEQAQAAAQAQPPSNGTEG